jgi:hypothetical protein
LGAPRLARALAVVVLVVPALAALDRVALMLVLVAPLLAQAALLVLRALLAQAAPLAQAALLALPALRESQIG